MSNRTAALLAATLALSAARPLPAQEPAAAPAAGTLTYAASYTSDVLGHVVSVDVSPDGRFLYTASYNARQVGVFARDAADGRLEPVRTTQDPDTLNGVTGLRVSPNGRYAAAAAFRSDAVTLFSRDAADGTLEAVDAVTGVEVPALDWTIDLAWSPDSRFLYAIADDGAAVVGFRVTPADGGVLEHVESQTGRDRCFRGARGIALAPDGRRIYVVSKDAGTLVTLGRDPEAGTTRVQQVLRAGGGDGAVAALDGVFGVAVAPDGRSVYTSSGRYRGANAVAVFRAGEDGGLRPVQELIDGTDALDGFVGGNEIAVSPDGRNVYAVAPRSDALAAFTRDPDTGELTQIRSLRHDADGPLGTASGLTVSPDGRFVYVAAETSDAVTVYRRNTP